MGLTSDALYDEQNRLIRYVNFVDNNKNNVDLYCDYKYLEDGTQVFTEREADGSLERYSESTKDSDGHFVSKRDILKREDGGYTEKLYDDSGKLEKTSLYDENGKYLCDIKNDSDLNSYVAKRLISQGLSDFSTYITMAHETSPNLYAVQINGEGMVLQKKDDGSINILRFDKNGNPISGENGLMRFENAGKLSEYIGSDNCKFGEEGCFNKPLNQYDYYTNIRNLKGNGNEDIKMAKSWEEI